MPCRSDYLEPTEREREIRRAAQLLVFVYEEQGKEPLDEHLRLAQMSYPKNDRVIPELCAEIRKMTDEDRERIVFDAHRKQSRDLADWWDRHLEADRKREEKERQNERRKQLREQGLSKLSKEEREALGLRYTKP